MKDSIRETLLFEPQMLRTNVSSRQHMLNRNEHFAEIQADAFAVTWITELAPLDHEEAYSVNRRQSQTWYCTLLRPVRRGLNSTFPPLMPHGFPLWNFTRSVTFAIARDVQLYAVIHALFSPVQHFPLNPRDKSSHEDRSKVSNCNVICSISIADPNSILTFSRH